MVLYILGGIGRVAKRCFVLGRQAFVIDCCVQKLIALNDSRPFRFCHQNKEATRVVFERKALPDLEIAEVNEEQGVANITPAMLPSLAALETHLMHS